MRRTAELLKKVRYHKDSNQKARSQIYDNITKSGHYYYEWTHRVLQPPQFPHKPRVHRTLVYQKNLFNPTVKEIPGVKGRVSEEALKIPEKMITDLDLSEKDVDNLEKPELAYKKLVGYAPYHAYKRPFEQLPGFLDVNRKIERDLGGFGDDYTSGKRLPEASLASVPEGQEAQKPKPNPKIGLSDHHKKILYNITSYKYASKDMKQEHHFNDMMKQIRKNMPAIRPVDLTEGQPIYKLVYMTSRIRNLIEDAQELYARKRYENQRKEKPAYDEKREEVRELLRMRSETLIDIKRQNIDHYFGLIEMLNIEVVDPPRRTLSRDGRESHRQRMAMRSKYKYINYDKRIRDPLVTKKAVRSMSNTMDYVDMHVNTLVNKHTAQIMDMRVRTFTHMERLADEKISQQGDMASDIKLENKRRLNELLDECSEEGRETWLDVFRLEDGRMKLVHDRVEAEKEKEERLNLSEGLLADDEGGDGVKSV